MFQRFCRLVLDIFTAIKNNFLSFIKECTAALQAAKASTSSDKSVGEQVGEHVGCAVCELGVDLLKRAVKIFLSSLIAYFGGRVFGRFLPVHAGWHNPSMMHTA